MSPRRSSAALQHLRLVATNHYQEREGVMAPSFYIFNVGEDQGYIIAAADDRAPAVLGYSDQGSFDPEDIPVNMQAWLEEYNNQMEYLNRHPEAAAPQNTVSGETISPLLGNIEWNQRNPYNSQCPLDGDKRSLTGCVATAMAQIMFYWSWPNQTAADIPAYVTKNKGFSLSAISAGTPIDWANMLPKYTGNETTDQIDAVANLMLMCGTAVQMNYSNSSSSAYSKDVSKVWKLYFDFDAATTYQKRADYRLAAWSQKVYDELAAQRPVLYSGSSSGGSHAFVIDGYGGNGYFHVNWGWGGSSNDYFLLSILDPHDNSGAGASSSTDGYSYDQQAVFGAQPNTGVTFTAVPVLSSDKAVLPYGNKSTRFSSLENFSFQVAFSYWNYMDNTYDFDYNVALYDDNDNYLGIVSSTKSYDGLQSGTGFSNSQFTVHFGKGLNSGTYKLKPVSREKGTSQWQLNNGSETTFITATINSNTITLTEPLFGLTGSFETKGKSEVGSPLTLTATITNQGTLYNGQIFLLADGNTKDNLVAGRHFDIDAGQTKEVDFTYTPNATGEKSFSLCTRVYNSITKEYDYTPFIAGTITISDASTYTLSMKPKTKNAVYENGQNVVKENKAIVSIDVMNTGNADYDNDVIVKLYKKFDDKNGNLVSTRKKAIQLTAGASKNIEMEFDNLENEGKYFYYVLYLSEGKEVKGYQYSPTFVVQIESGDDPVTLVDGTLNCSSSGETEIVGIYDVSGRHLNSLQRGTNIIRMSNGQTKKVIVK